MPSVPVAPAAPPAALDPARLARAEGLWRRAVSENDALRPVAATALLRRALTAVAGTGEPAGVDFAALAPEAAALAVQITITRAKSEAELAGRVVALELLDVAEQWAARDHRLPSRVSIANQRGLLQLRSGNPAAALAEFVAAEQWFDDAPVVDVCKVLLNRGVARLEQLEFREARRDLARCAELAATTDLSTLHAMAEHNRGYVEFLAGNLVDGLDAMRVAARPETGIPMGVSHLDQARLLVEAGLTREADKVLTLAAEIFRRDRMAQELAETELSRADCALLTGDPAASRRLAASARNRFRRRGNDRWRRAAELVLLQGDLAVGRPGRRLTGPAQRLRDEFGAEGLRLPARTAGLLAAEAHLAAGQLDAARHTLRTLPRRRPHDPITSRLHERLVAAETSAAGHDRRAAVAEVRRGLRELADYQASFGSIDLRTAAAVHGRQLTQLDLALALEQGPAQVFAAAERARAVSSRLPPVRPPDDPYTADLLAELRRTVEELRAPVGEPGLLLRRRQELEREIAARRWTLPGSGTARPIARLGEVRAGLVAADAAMVTFVSVRGQVHGLVTRSGRLRLMHLGGAEVVQEWVRRIRADLDVLAAPLLPASLRAVVEGSFRRSATALDDLLVRPLRLDSSAVLVTTGVLGQVPWSSLPSLRAVPLVVAPSATSWLAATGAVVAAADAAGADVRPGNRRTGLIALAGPDLGRAEEEARAIDPGARVGADATRSALLRALDSARIVHIAAHGVHETENPLFSSLRLADGPLFAHELDASTTTPGHVVLSACELGLATVRPGDEALGLTSVLLQLGTRCVVAGVARVGDDVAAAVMVDYHRRLAAGQPAAAALAGATAASDRPAPFVCFGADGVWS